MENNVKFFHFFEIVVCVLQKWLNLGEFFFVNCEKLKFLNFLSDRSHGGGNYTKIKVFFTTARKMFLSSLPFTYLYCFASYPVDTGRKLKVLRTFNLRPVSTG